MILAGGHKLDARKWPKRFRQVGRLQLDQFLLLLASVRLLNVAAAAFCSPASDSESGSGAHTLMLL